MSRIFPSKTSGIGNCNYCQLQNVEIARVSDLTDLLTAVLNIYDEDQAGTEIVDQLIKDWALFQSPGMDRFRASKLITDIMGDGEISRRKFAPSARFTSDRLIQWSKLRDELMYRNRYFPDTELDADRLGELLDLLSADAMPDEWYRARIQPGDEPFSIDKMGAPPRQVASHGRANPAGIPYLYIGSTPHTAVAEVRPHTGEIASVAAFKLAADDLRLVDLRAPRERVSPFTLGDEDEIGALRSDVTFLERLGEELTRPVRPSGAPIEYVPSQYLCEFIKKAGWDGVIYRSSVSDGINLALFEPSQATAMTVSRWRVSRVAPEIEPIGEVDLLTAEKPPRTGLLARLIKWLPFIG